MKDIIKIVKSLEDSCLLLKWVSETFQNKAKEQKGEFIGMLQGTLGASLLGNILVEKGMNTACLFKLSELEMEQQQRNKVEEL